MSLLSSSRPLNNEVHQIWALIYFCFPYTLSLEELIHSISFCIPNTESHHYPKPFFYVWETSSNCHLLYEDISKALWIYMPQNELMIFFFRNGLENDVLNSLSLVTKEDISIKLEKINKWEKKTCVYIYIYVIDMYIWRKMLIIEIKILFESSKKQTWHCR